MYNSLYLLFLTYTTVWTINFAYLLSYYNINVLKQIVYTKNKTDTRKKKSLTVYYCSVIINTRNFTYYYQLYTSRAQYRNSSRYSQVLKLFEITRSNSFDSADKHYTRKQYVIIVRIYHSYAYTISLTLHSWV